MNKLILSVLFLIINISVFSQKKTDLIMTMLDNFVPIYEIGSPLTSCESNFENLFKNWTAVNVTNAHEYELLDFKFVETIADTKRYNYYRNYFSGGEPVGSSISTKSSTKGSYKTLNGKRVLEETKIYERFVKPTFIFSEFFDQRGSSEETKKILSEEFTRQARELLMREINIDTMKLIYKEGKIIKTKKAQSSSGELVRKKRIEFDLASTDSISRQVFDNLSNTRRETKSNTEVLSIEEKRAFGLEEILVLRISSQSIFNKNVHFGDKVYVVRFRYYGATYPVYVICNPDTKKVVIDSFFKNITIDKTEKRAL
jgi:hypothetical protein